MKSFDLFLRYVIIFIAWELACAWIETFQSPWPLTDAFKTAPSAEEQLLQSLGISFDGIRSMGFSRFLVLILRFERNVLTGLFKTAEKAAVSHAMHLSCKGSRWCLMPLLSNILVTPI